MELATSSRKLSLNGTSMPPNLVWSFSVVAELLGLTLSWHCFEWPESKDTLAYSAF